MHNTFKHVILASSVILAACSSSDSDSPNAQQLTLKDYQGIWLAPAYGKGIKIDASNAERFDYSQQFCLLEERFEDIDLAALNAEYRLQEGTLEVREGDDSIVLPGAEFEKVAGLPASCAQGYDAKFGDPDYVDDPERDLNYYAETLANLSVSIEVNNLNWAQTHAQALAYLRAEPSQERLLEVLAHMTAALKDGHSTLGEGDDQLMFFNKPLLVQSLVNEYLLVNQLDSLETPEQVQAAEDYVVQQIALIDEIIADYAQTEVKQGAGVLTWFENNGIGYLRIAAMDPQVDQALTAAAGQYDDDSAPEASVALRMQALDTAMAQAMLALRDTQGLIIDVRTNTGGSDEYAMALAGYFTDVERLAYRKQARNGNQRTLLRDVFLSPRGDQAYLKQVVLLTSPTTSSAAEVFTLAMKQLPHVTTMGQATQGSLSDSLDKRMPNGLAFSLSNEYYLSVAGQWYEGRGIPADIDMANFGFDERLNEEDLVIEAAFALLVGDD